MNEVFKDIKNYEGLYQISNYGRVKSLPKNDGNGKRERILKTDKSKTNAKGIPYRRVTFSVAGKQVRYLVHQLVAEHFLEPDDTRLYVNHIDGNPSNNHYSNLEWCTGSENMQHAYQTGLSTHAQTIASKKASELNQVKMKSKLETTLGHNFIDEFVIDKRRWVKYSCPSCLNTFTHRTDNPSVKRGGICRGCFIKVKI